MQVASRQEDCHLHLGVPLGSEGPTLPGQWSMHSRGGYPVDATPVGAPRVHRFAVQPLPANKPRSGAPPLRIPAERGPRICVRSGSPSGLADSLSATPLCVNSLVQTVSAPALAPVGRSLSSPSGRPRRLERWFRLARPQQRYRCHHLQRDSWIGVRFTSLTGPLRTHRVAVATGDSLVILGTPPSLSRQ